MHVLSSIHDPRLAGAHDIQLQGNLAFIAGKGPGGNREPPFGAGSFGIVDVSTPEAIHVVGGWTYPPVDGARVQAETVMPAGKACFVAGTHFDAVDVTDPASPRLLARIQDARIESVNGMARRGEYLLAATKHGRINVFHVGDAQKPRLRDSLWMEGERFTSPHDLDLLGDEHIVVGNISGAEQVDRVRVYRVAAPGNAAPWPAAEWALEGVIADRRLTGANRIRVRGKRAYVACNKGDALAVVGLADPQHPEIEAWLATPSGPSGLCLAGNGLIANPGSRGAGDFLEIYDASSPGELELAARQQFPELTPDHDMVYRDGVIYCTDQDEDGVGVIAVEEPELRRLLDTPVA